ncbi:TetR/AcrR family transcriptional regulator [Arenibaculum pallidiluteum]|uniref:TetR/AcrR family transcriptional regulator n=1 Tax=Arenibaculum pallidiluteum TaxID=2812559 RepID=UPI001A95EBB6|nr:TetR/AcrR family transcriptional regulator [Arenibaculum pallidiluteum]
MAGLRTNDPDGMRRRVLDAAFSAFCGQGYHATAMHELRTAAGVTGGALSHHFPSKKELVLAVIRDRVADAVERTWLAPLRDAPTTIEGVHSVLEAIAVELDRNQVVRGCPLNNLALELSGQDTEFRAAIDAIFGRWRAAVAEKLRADLEQGLVRPLDPGAAATLVVAAYSGAMAMAKAAQSAEPLRTCADQLAWALRP